MKVVKTVFNVFTAIVTLSVLAFIIYIITDPGSILEPSDFI